jgi:hypothetical protein
MSSDIDQIVLEQLWDEDNNFISEMGSLALLINFKICFCYQIIK